MNLALIGYGKMGQMVEQLATARGHKITFKVDIEGNEQGQALTRENLAGADVAVNFSTPDSVVLAIDKVSAAGVSMIVGTTGWTSRLEEVRRMINERNVGLVYGSNFSIGVNLFFRLAQQAAEIFHEYAEYDPWIYEIHHRAKLDAPSGTALKLELIVEKEYADRKVVPASNRAGAHPGEHTLGFDSDADTLRITHTARSRVGFAIGALRAAEWVRGKKGLYEFGETLEK
ncbi:MAG: 4-hydroxy-tetrahydrodipicolinate reductase [Acidobacteria bacterium]|nr:4-hydroxy-tetrahydrodipicolinate reductase [Acidobacteriota bacterium]